MPNIKPSEPSLVEKPGGPKILAWAGGGLFFLGLAATFLAFTETVVADKVNMVLYAAVLLSLGYPLLLYAQALNKFADLEKRLRELEQRPRP